MKWGSAYGPDDVNVLYSMVRRHLAFVPRFVCFTDDASGLDPAIETQPIPEFDVPAFTAHKPWRKLTTLMPGFGGLSGKTLFLDLDVVVTGDLDPLFEYSDKFAISENWSQPGTGVGNSSVYCYEIGQYAWVLDVYRRDYETLFAQYPNSQTFMSKTLGPENIEYWPPDWVVSFKYTCMDRGPMRVLTNAVQVPHLPEGARVVAFHGNPKPSDALAGRYPGPWYKRVRATPWIAQHYK
ncbi:MAG: hypothetical protein AAGB03_03730 [Pseudomonadota bacterium]